MTVIGKPPQSREHAVGKGTIAPPTMWSPRSFATNGATKEMNLYQTIILKANEGADSKHKR